MILLICASVFIISVGIFVVAKITGDNSPQASSSEQKSTLSVVSPENMSGEKITTLNPSTAGSAPGGSSSGIIQRDGLKVEAISRNVNGINVMIDPRIELLAIVQLISDYDSRFGLITRFHSSYKDNMKKHFNQYSKHPAVKLFEKMSEKGFSYHIPPALMLYCSNPPELNRVRDYGDYFEGRAEKIELDKFIEELQNFARDTDFSQFFLANEDFYNTVLDKNIMTIRSTPYIAELESYFGMKQNSYTIILSPLFHAGGFGPRLDAAYGKYDIYSILGPTRIDKNTPIFSSNISWHEFGHSFVNPLSEKNQDEVNKYQKLYTPLAVQMKSQAYPNWLTCVNEHVDRAVTCRLIYRNDGEAVYEKAVSSEKINGFLYIDALLEALEKYEKNRDRYKTFEDFYPEIINVFKTLSEKELGEDFYNLAGPINAIGTQGNNKSGDKWDFMLPEDN